VAAGEALARPAHRDSLDRPPDTVHRLLDHLGSDELLLFSSDYPHWQFDGDDAMPPGIPADLAGKIMVDNPKATYFARETAKKAAG
jgi:predicted TIM-barrel fold metal-dependent hydrolase